MNALASIRPHAFFALPAVALLLASHAAAEIAAFQRRVAAVGDAVEQRLVVQMRVEATARRGAETVEESTSSVHRQQRRRVVAEAIAGERIVAAQVRFFEATNQHNGETLTEPVAGKAYRCVREGERLIVTTADGRLPPMEEYEVVARAMETLGTASPLAEFLAGRTVSVGERLELPAELARKALGFDPKLGEVERFSLTLQSLTTVDSRRVANFAAEVEAANAGSQQMRLFVGGVFAIEEATCRVVSADLSGPIAMSGPRGPATAGYQLDGRGQMRIELTTRYHDAQP